MAKQAPALQVPWFPTTLNEINKIGDQLMEINEDKSVHEAFTDPVYRARRNLITDIALSHRMGQPIPQVDYTQEETQMWCRVYDKLTKLHKVGMCKSYLKEINDL